MNHSLVGNGKDFGFYSVHSGQPLEGAVWGVLVSDCFLGLSYSGGEWKRKQVAGSAMVRKHDVGRQWP